MTISAPWLSWPETQTLLAAFASAGAEMRFVGGCVRDTLLSRGVRDIDAATPLVPEQVMALLEKAGIEAIPTGLAHGTVTAVVNKKPFEITTLRKDVATDGRHATVAYTDDWKEDAARRDFTMNALYLSPDGELFDYFGGEADAKAGRVRFIGDATARIREDYLRILRFFRFWAHYGKTPPDAKTLAACASEAAQIETLSAERIQHEMLKLLAARKSHHAVFFMDEQKILPHAAGFGLAVRAPLRRLEEMAVAFSLPVSAAAKLACLMQSASATVAVENIAARWKLSNALTGHLQALMSLRPQLSAGLSFPVQKKLIRKSGNAIFAESVLLVWAAGDDIIDKSHPYHAMLTLAREWTPPTFPVSGKDLLALGIPEGKRMGELLAELEEQWEASGYTLERQELLFHIKG